jgi:hypothetical protein
MALKWAWAFSTDQTKADLEAIGWAVNGVSDPGYAVITHDYPGDAVAKRAALKQDYGQFFATPNGTAALDGWVCCSAYSLNGFTFQGFAWLLVEQVGLTGIYISPGNGATVSTVNLYVDNVFKATSTLTVVSNAWNFFAIKYEASTTSFKATVYVNGVEYIAQQTDTALTAWSDLTLMRVKCWGNGLFSSNDTIYGGVITYDDIADAGEIEVWCSTYEPQTDVGVDVGTWGPSSGATNFGVVTPWDDTTYTEEASPSSGDKFTCGFTDSIATRLGISPTIHAIVGQAAVSGGNIFGALLEVDGGGDLVGAPVTSDVNDPTYGYVTKAGGITAASVVKVGIKIP